MPASNNKRIYYAVHQVGIKADSAPGANFTEVHGAQSVGMTTNFNLEQVFELGQTDVYKGLPCSGTFPRCSGQVYNKTVKVYESLKKAKITMKY